MNDFLDVWLVISKQRESSKLTELFCRFGCWADTTGVTIAGSVAERLKVRVHNIPLHIIHSAHEMENCLKETERTPATTTEPMIYSELGWCATCDMQHFRTRPERVIQFVACCIYAGCIINQRVDVL
jgi:hypothetical protein